MALDIRTEAEAFAKSYAVHFSSPDACSYDRVSDLARVIGEHYRPGLTMFTNGNIGRFQTQTEAATLIETEMRNNLTSGLVTKLVLDRIDKVESYSETSALCWLTWTFHPQVGSEFEGRGWTFTNVYGYRSATEGHSAGWEFVVRDQEVNEIRRVTGKTFEES